MTTPTDDEIRSRMDREAARIQEDVEYTFKSHYNSGDFWAALRYLLGVPAALLATLAGAGAAQDWSRFWIGAFAITGAALMSLLTFLNPVEKARLSRVAANGFKTNHVAFRQFRELDVPRWPVEQSREQLDVLTRQRQELIERAPPFAWRAFHRARQGIEDGEAKYVVDAPLAKR